MSDPSEGSLGMRPRDEGPWRGARTVTLNVERP